MSENAVLMIDDDDFTIDLQQMLLDVNKVSGKVYFERSGKSAIQKLHSLNGSHLFPNYILLDINMPDMSGFQFLTEFENEFYAQHANTKIIMITSSIRDGDRRKALAYTSVSEFVVKPLPNNYILNLLKKGISEFK